MTILLIYEERTQTVRLAKNRAHCDQSKLKRAPGIVDIRPIVTPFPIVISIFLLAGLAGADSGCE
jgi:hypothetical protein